MTRKQLKIKLLPNGEIQMETIGIKGKKCLDYVEMLKVLADAKIEKTEYKSDFYEQEEYEYLDDNNEINYE